MLPTLWLLGSVIVGFLGRDREFGYWGFFLGSLLVSPVIALLILLLTAPARRVPAQGSDRDTSRRDSRT